jgi:hypothetical protein
LEHNEDRSREQPRKEAEMPLQTFALLDTLKHVEIAGHQQCGSLEVFHLRWPAGDGLTYSTLDEALEAHWIEVAECRCR